MGIGTSTGQYFDDAMHMAASPYVQDPADAPQEPQKQERLYVSPNDNRALGVEQSAMKPPEAYRTTPNLGDVVNRNRAEKNIVNPEGAGDASNFDALTRDQNEYTPEGVENLYLYRQNLGMVPEQISSTTSTMLPGSPTEATGALNQSGGTLPALSFLRAGGALNSAVDTTIGALAHPVETAEGFVKGIGNALATPHDVMTGEVPAGSTREIERAADLAGLMVTGPAPVASKMADGTLGSFMGVKSATFDQKMLQKAKDLEAAGTHPDEIWQKTKTFRAADDNWKQEIPDEKAELKDGKLGYNSKNEVSIYNPAEKPNPSDYPQTRKGVEKWKKDWENYNNPSVKLSDILDHPELYKAYPWLANKEVKAMPAGIKAEGMAGGDALYISKMEPEEFRQTLLHEIQHYIQHHEGFSKGGQWNVFAPQGFPEMFAKLKDTLKQTEKALKQRGLSSQEIVDLQKAAEEDLAGTMPADIKKIIENHPAKEDYDKIKALTDARQRANEIYKEAYQKYQNLMGEVEARNVEARSRMPKHMRNVSPPEETEDVFRERQLKNRFSIPSASEKPIDFRRAANDNLPENHPDRPYNDRDPSMIGSREADKRAEDSWNRIRNRQKIDDQINKLLFKYPHSEFDKARLEKLRKQADDLWKW